VCADVAYSALPALTPIAYLDVYFQLRLIADSDHEVRESLLLRLRADVLHVYFERWIPIGERKIAAGYVAWTAARWVARDPGDSLEELCCWAAGGAVLMTDERGELLRAQPVFDARELVDAYPGVTWLWATPPAPEDELVNRLAARLEAQPKIRAEKLYIEAAGQSPRFTVRTKDDRKGQADVPSPVGRAGRDLIKRARQQARSPQVT
jgi:hypothetical protein